MRHKPFWQVPPPGQYGHIRGVYNKQQICLPLHNCIFISLVNPLPKNTIEQREDDLEKRKGCTGVAKSYFYWQCYFDSPLLKASKATTNCPQRSCQTKSLFPLKGVRTFTITSARKKKTKTTENHFDIDLTLK